ncbi:MAG: hypothetical protein J6B68_04575 [Lachnospiraceae bacterium]|nr:hypothetical protein [Lachnospiraceae bacterium]
MKYIFRLMSKSKKGSLEDKAYRALVINTALWFLIGCVAAWVICGACRAPEDLVSSYMVTTGACSSLIVGYGAGVVWLLRHAE